MNNHQKSYLDGAAMAYRDVAKLITGMISRSPAEIKSMVEIMRPIADVCEKKAMEVYKEAERIEHELRQ